MRIIRGPILTRARTRSRLARASGVRTEKRRIRLRFPRLRSTVEILITHIVIMHNSHNALSFRGSRVGIRGKWVNIAYCIMHEVSGSIMHYEDTLYKG